MTIESLATIAYSITGIVSLLYIARQVKMTRNQAKGEFLFALDDRLTTTNKITIKLFNEQNFSPSGREWGEVWQLMNIYERMNIMLDDKMVDLAIVERAYGFRVLALIQNDDIFNQIIKTGAEWPDFIALCQKLAKYYSRKKNSESYKVFLERVKQLDRDFPKVMNPWLFE